jgi:hypothetical protein
MKFFSVVSLAFALALGLGAPTVAKADIADYTFTLGGSCCGTGTFGTIAVTNGTGAFTGDYKVDVEMSPNNLILTSNNNAHVALTFELSGLSHIVGVDTASTTAGFSILQNGGTSNIQNSPYSNWNYGISCGNGPTGGCGSSLIFYLNSIAFLADTNNDALFAADIYCKSCSPKTDGTQPTGIVAVPVSVSVPAPILGAGLPGLIAACLGLVAFARRRRNSFA